MNSSPANNFILRLAIAGLFLSVGLEKINDGWLYNAEPLTTALNNYHEKASGAQLSYLDHVAIPYAGLWSKLMAVGETALGISLLLGLLVRLSTLIGIIMVISFHAANGTLYSINFFGSPWGALLLAGMLVMFLSRAGRWLGGDALLAKWNSNGALW